MSLDPKLVREYTRGLKLLYVEDDAAVAQETMDLLKSFFTSVDYAENGEQGLQMYEKSTGYDLIITDIRMPKMDGIEMSRQILKKHHDQKVIVISAHSESEYLYELINLGVDRFIVKPLRTEQLLQALYLTCKGIVNFKLVSQYFDEIAQLNIQLERKNRQLQEQNEELMKSQRLLDTQVKKGRFNQYVQRLKEEYANLEAEEQAKRKGSKQAPSCETDTQSQTAFNDMDQADLKELQMMVQRDFPELEELYTEMEAIIILMVTNGDVSRLAELGNLLGSYATVLSGYSIFYKLSTSLNGLSELIKSEPLPEDGEVSKSIFLMIESFLYTLQRWQQAWSHNEVKDVNYFDASLCSDIETIQGMWTNQENTGDIEFF